jgi:hypothetical protein
VPFVAHVVRDRDGHAIWIMDIPLRNQVISYRNEERLAEIRVSDEFVLEHFPDLHVDSGGDEMHGKPHDTGEVRL